jgi:hypothetical protein
LQRDLEVIFSSKDPQHISKLSMLIGSAYLCNLVAPVNNSSSLDLRIDERQKPINIQTNEQGPV